ncbi:MAG: pseudouridine synthase, partial [Pseudomonadota bacterium]|nr:pseudouridine synthase [Pseudomonadota bacterium]
MALPPKTSDPEASPSAEPRREGERIAKLLARAGIASRREVERLIEAGRIKLDDEVITTPATVLTSLRGITVDGEPVKAPEAARLYAFNKPPGLLTAERDPAGRATIYSALRNSLPEGSPRLMPVGRLDLNTEGLLLLTNDGELKRAMELPSSGVPRTYRARTFGPVTQDQLEELMIGVEIEGVRYGSINANMERSTGANQWIELTLTEGKNREIRRVLEHLGLQVSRLIRIAYGPFLLGDLPRGAAVEIAQVQVERFRKGLKMPATTQQPAFAVQAGPMMERAGKAKLDEPRGKRVPGRRKPDPSRPDESAGRRNGPQAPAPSRRSDQSRVRSGPARGTIADHPAEANSRYNSASPRPGGDRRAGPGSPRGPASPGKGRPKGPAGGRPKG